jgi:DNA polymerase-3 subunit delta'
MKDERVQNKLNLFQQAIKNNRLSHLYLISGLKGSGKKMLAYNVAAVLLNSDVETIKEGHINLFIIEPEGQNIKVSQVESLQEEFTKTSLVDGYRVFILNHVDRLNQSSANRLLKFLEEPVNKQTIGFLLTENIERVIPTILSRSQVVYLAGQDEVELTKKLKEKGVSNLVSELLPLLSKDIDELLILAEDENIKMIIDKFKGFTDAILESDNLWLYVDEHLKELGYTRDKDLVKYFLQFLIAFYLDVLKIKNNQRVLIVSFIDKYNELKTMDSNIIQEKLEKTQELLEKINYNVNIEMAFSQFIIDIS